MSHAPLWSRLIVIQVVTFLEDLLSCIKETHGFFFSGSNFETPNVTRF